MAIQVALEHRTIYRFDRWARLSPHVVRLRPAPGCRTPILAYSLRVEPEGHFINWQQDPFGNHVARLVFPEPARMLSITVDIVAEMTVINPFDFFLEPEAERYPFGFDPALARDLAPYLATGEPGGLLRQWLADVHVPPGGEATVDFLVGVNRRVQQAVVYTTRFEPGVQTPEETLDKGLGSCRDSAWLLTHVLRGLGLAARFVSGYLVQLKADQAPLEGPAGRADFTDLHAWSEVYVPGAGWIGLDPTSGLFAGEGHLPLACTPDPAGAAAVTGEVQPCETTLEYTNVVRRIREDPRVTAPYTDTQWEAIDALGRAVDADLQDADVRLTHGGEPTFVSVDGADAAEWSTAADGTEKRSMAWALTERLAARFSSGGIVHNGQGKWYPGEALPRWQLAVVWRPDGVPLWEDPKLLADPWTAGKHSALDAERLVLDVAARLGIPADCCVAGYEDAMHRLWTEARLPGGDVPGADVDPADPGLAAPDTRRRIVAALDAESGDPIGWVLPLHHTHLGGGGWASTRWALRRGRLALTPGESPMGLRLPLDALTWTPAPASTEPSSFEARAALPPRGHGRAPTGAAPVVPVGEAPPTALCAEVRHGRLHVFLPPLERLEHAVELLAVVEAAASALATPVVLEGYALPRDPRLSEIVVGPDPGVIEVNLQPAASWPELVEIVTAVYADAHSTRLGTEKFQLDGSHTGTGGGNHMTLGGPTPADSPLLRRPDLLRSLVTYWQHHPSLSYLFSGRFIGPTSQAPRVDEARDDSLYELEIAFRQLDGDGGDRGRPWLVDRLLRNLLVDVAGNTHRAEFCIDKLFNPEGERGRLGLVELRAFEMPPHPKMALVQALLVRALVARFWQIPYAGDLVRWGCELHDRFMLPWYVAADIEAVVDALRDHGLAFEHAWLAPFLEFRFPRIGSVQVAGATVELRAAIEPWPVLGEEVGKLTTARYVDSSTERIQVLVSGLTDGRHVITCNGRPVPLHPTERPDTFVAGVRYKAWKPPSALHPTIGVHAPLVFDVIDRWSSRSLGGCTYHVSHSGGRSYDRLPVNANEAEARRTSRFDASGHTPGRVDIAAIDRAATSGSLGHEYPRTLDLRRSPGTWAPSP